MRDKVVPVILIAVLLGFVVPGSGEIGRAQEDQVIKISMIAPRESPLFTQFQKLSEKLKKATKGAWKLRLFAAGVAGDEKDAIKKMQVGQLDSSVLTTTALGTIEPQVAVLDTPSLVRDYKDLEAVEKVMDAEIPPLLEKKKVKLLTSWEAGQYRMLHRVSQKDASDEIRLPSDLKKHREWLLPENYILKEMWRAAGATGVPLGITDVFAALQTGMVDVITVSAYATVQMRWHTRLNRISERAQGVLMFFWVINGDKWQALPPDVQKLITEDLPAMRRQAKIDSRKADQEAYDALIKRGYTPIRLTPKEDTEWTKLFDTVTKRLTGRLWSETLFNRLLAAKQTAR